MSTGVGMSSCCISGKVHDGTPVGHVEEIGGLQTYVTEPESKSKAKTLIFIVDSKRSLLPCSVSSILMHPHASAPLSHTSPLTIPYSFWLGIQEHPSAGRQLCQRRFLCLCPGRPPGRFPARIISPERRTPTQRPRTTRHRRQSQERRHCPGHPWSVANKTPRGRQQASDRQLHQRRAHDSRHG